MAVERIPIKYQHSTLHKWPVIFDNHIRDLHPNRFKRTIFGSTNKAIQFLIQEGKPYMDTDYPILNISWTYLGVDDVADFNWRSHRVSPLFPFYMDDILHIDLDRNTSVAFITKRLQFQLGLTAWFPSHMETHDFIIDLLNYYINVGNYSPLIEADMFFVVPSNPKLLDAFDWSSSPAITDVLKSIGQEKMFYRLKYHPVVKLEALTENSSFYGGDVLPEYMVSATFTIDLEVPIVLLLLDTSGVIKEIKPDFKLDAAYLPQVVYDYTKKLFVRGRIYPENGNMGDVIKIAKNIGIEVLDAIIVEFDQDIPSGYEVDLPHAEDNKHKWLFVYYMGELYPDQYTFITDTRVRFNVEFQKDTKLECVYYRMMG